MFDARSIRRRVRDGTHARHTAGLAPGALQVNLVILAKDVAKEFSDFCNANAQACPLIAVTEPGQTDWPMLGSKIDIRRDVPAYNVYRHGRLAQTCADLTEIWRDDLVSFALGCSFTFEHALLRAGLPVRNIEANATVPMFRTNVGTKPVGPFRGPLVVSMRPIPDDRVDEARAISARYPWAHGAPVHVGDPGKIGITDLTAPDWGTPSEIRTGEVPVFWACGVTPQTALLNAALPFSITHRPGHMLVTDLPQDDPFGGRNPRSRGATPARPVA